jgi:hypothetical protein
MKAKGSEDPGIMHQYKVIDEMKEKIDYAINDLFHRLYENFCIMYEEEGETIGNAVYNRREALLKIVAEGLDDLKDRLSVLPQLRDELISSAAHWLNKDYDEDRSAASE